MYKIYINDSPLFLCSTEELQKLNPDNFDLTFLYTGNKKRLHNVIDMLDKGSRYNRVILHTPAIKSLWKDFKSIHRMIIAGGGLVFNDRGEILAIHRNGRWDLPKGKIEKDESNKKGARREVKEECGIKKLKVLKKAYVTYHIYRLKGKKILKKTIWYFMTTPNHALTPQIEEGIDQAIWIDPDEFIKNHDMHGNIRAFIKDAYFKKLRV